MSSEDLHTRSIGRHDWYQQKGFTFWTGVQRRMAAKDISWPIITIIVQPWSGAACTKCRIAVRARIAPQGSAARGMSRSELLLPPPDDRLHLWPVSKRVNRTGNVDGPRPFIVPQINSKIEPARPGARPIGRVMGGHQTTNLGVGSSNLSGRANIINVLAASVLPRKCHWRAHGDQANWPAEIHPDDRFYEARGCARARGILGH